MLIRALEPTAGSSEMRARRGGRADAELCSGPGKLTEALGVGLEANGADIGASPFASCRAEGEWSGVEVVTGPRIGITKATERPWRFCAAGNPHVSRPRTSGSARGGATRPAAGSAAARSGRRRRWAGVAGAAGAGSDGALGVGAGALVEPVDGAEVDGAGAE